MSESRNHLALVGSPNCGKSTLFNWLTGASAKVVNYPGSTVEYSVGSLVSHLESYVHSVTTIMDTPGTYSLTPRSQDEWVTWKSIFENSNYGLPNLLLVVIDGTQLSRQLSLVEQVRRTGLNFKIIITMNDLLEKENIHIKIAEIGKYFNTDVFLFDGLLGSGLIDIAKSFNFSIKSNSDFIAPDPLAMKLSDLEFQNLDILAKSSTENSQQLKNIELKTRKLDDVLLHPFLGIVFFISIMTFLFASLFWFSAPLMDAVDQAFASLSELIQNQMPESLLREFVTDGVVASFAAVLVFIPQIFILFFGMSFLEASGYLARAAVIIDRPFKYLGLSGRSFVPLLSGYACAVPAMMAARNINSTRERLMVTFIIPLLTCSARLPVYALMISFLMLGNENALIAGMIMAGLYLGALVIAAFAALLLNKIITKDSQSFFIMELPIYRRPRFVFLLTQAMNRSWLYVKKAGPMIFIISLIIWGGTRFPRSAENVDAATRIQNSYLGQLGTHFEPILSPMGADWRVGIGLIASFAAREVFVSTLAITMNIEEQDEEVMNNSLLSSLVNAKNFTTGAPLFTVPSVMGLIVFFMIALQCMTTFAVAVKEMGGLKWAIMQLVSFNVVAYILAVVTYQSLSLFFG